MTMPKVAAWYVACVAIVGAVGFAAAAQPVATDWAALARADIESGYRLMRDNHPGLFDPLNPEFPAQLARARKRALALAGRARSLAGYVAVLGAFNAVLNDGHAALSPPPAESLAAWPGFLTAWRDGELRVFESTLEVPARGDRIASCDGTPIRELVERNVLEFVTHNGEQSAWWRFAPRVLLDLGNPFIRRPTQCVFETGNGRQRRELVWRSIEPKEFYARLEVSLNGERLPVGMSERASGIFWIALPTFSPDAAARAEYQRLFTDLEAGRKQLQQARAVVLDLRYNSGGSSDWSVKVANRLWGEARVAATMDDYFKGVQVLWRATNANAVALEEYVRQYREQGANDGANALQDIASAIRTGMREGKPLVLEPVSAGTDWVRSDQPVAAAEPQADLSVPVYVVVPAQCASACLDALDVFTRFPGVTLIGAPSSTDSTYLDIRFESLPSGKSRAVLPMKVWVGRPRASGAGYAPAIEITDLDWSTATFLTRIEADLANRR